MTRLTSSLLGVGLPLAALAVALNPGDANACGGTFCDAQPPGPQQMPVDQTGENILFHIDRETGQVEAHIQIQYEGDPERFAWLIPVQAKPDVEVGSDPLFQNLLNSTVPIFTLDQQFETGCGGGGASFPVCFAGGSDKDLAGGFGDGGDGDQEEPEGPDIVERGIAGAFQYDILQGGTVEGVVDWLDTAGYLQDDDAPPILAEYLDEGFLFVAIKLQAGAGVDEIHPLVIRYAGMEPCIPIRLTRIAAVPDMGIRTFFLGDRRVAPQNYAHVEINPLKFNWLGIGQGTTGYNQALSMAVDEAEEGHAFVTEYAGASSIVPQTGLVDGRWDSEAFIDAEAVSVPDLLSQQGLIECEPGFGCQFMHPMVQPLLDEYLPVPDTISPEDFYSCPVCFESMIDQDAWDGPAFAADMEERIIVPGEHALDLLDQNDYLTRMFTTLSPEEMTVDPLFHENADLPDVSNQHSATRWFACEGPDWLELDDGRVIALDGNQAPSLEDQPWALRVEQTMASGAPQAIEDNEAEIEASLEAWNEDQREIDRGGCGCRAMGIGPEALLFYGVVFGIAWPRRRRR